MCSAKWIAVGALWYALLVCVAKGFLPRQHRARTVRSCFLAAAVAGDTNVTNNNNSNAASGKSGYRFGDFTRSLVQKATSPVTQLTGKESYEFGDLSRWMDQKAKNGINQITGQDEYQFGDLTRWVDTQAKMRVNNYTNQEAYRVGDITREVVRRVTSGEYELGDVFLALRVLVSAGVSLSPLASALPIKVVMELVNLGLTQEVGGRVMSSLGQSLDERFKLALTGDSHYRLGDKTKQELQKALRAFIGKDEYEFGDISRRLNALGENKGVSGDDKARGLSMAKNAALELSDWDKRFQENEKGKL